MSKQEKKITDPRFCETHEIAFTESNEWDFETESFPWHCPKCQREKELKKREDYSRKAKIFEAEQSLDLPKRLASYTFGTFKETQRNKKIRDICIEYVNNWPQPGGIIMLGGVGTGKTHLAVAICKYLCSLGVVCKFTTVNKIVRDVRSVWGGKQVEKTEENIIEHFTRIDLLVIDEIGSQYGSESEKIIINEIINNRYEEMLPTIVMGNLTTSEIKSTLGARVVDRLTHKGHTLFFEWESLRK